MPNAIVAKDGTQGNGIALPVRLDHAAWWSTWTAVPDVLLDYWLPRLSGAEQKIILYIVRHTNGYHREKAQISESRFLNGTLSADGRRLDWGAGVGADALADALRAGGKPRTGSDRKERAKRPNLVSRGLVLVERARAPHGGCETNRYSLNLAPSKEGEPAPTLEGYRGALPLRFTQIPNIVFDRLLPHLSGSELKVLLFILRWTHGKKEPHADISKAQMVHGYSAENGRVYGEGTGLSKRSVDEAVKALVDKSIIFGERQRTPAGDYGASRYGLVIEDSVSSASNPAGVVQETPACVAQNAPEGWRKKPARGDATDPDGGGARNPLHETLTRKTDEIRRSKQQHADPASESEDVVVALVEQGVTEKTARRLVARHPADLILDQIEMLEYRRLDTNRAGALVKAIEDEWAAPEGCVPTVERERQELEEWEAEAAWRWQLEHEERLRDRAALGRWTASLCAARGIEPPVAEFWEYARDEWLPRLLGSRLGQKYFRDTLLEIDKRRATVWFRSPEAERVARDEVPEVVRSALRLGLGRDVPVEYLYWDAGDLHGDEPAVGLDRVQELRAGAEPEWDKLEPFGGYGLGTQQAWAVTLMELQSVPGAGHYLRGSRLLGRDGEEVVIRVATAYAAEWLSRHAAARAGEVLSAIGGESVGVRFVAQAGQCAVAI